MSDPSTVGRAWTRSDDLNAVTDFLRPRRNGATVLEIARGTDLSAVVVVPALDRLLADGVVRRRMLVSDGTGPRSAFVLTSSGRRSR
jgi:predicted transcriptional regulator